MWYDIMSLFTGYTENVVADKGLNMKGNINMDFYQLSNIAAPAEKYDAISYDWFVRNSRSQYVIYKYLGFTALNQNRPPDYTHGNYRGSDVLHSSSFTSSSKLFLSDISLDDDSLDYDMKFRFYARLIYYDGVTADFDISSGGIELKSRPNFTITFRDDTVRWIDMGIEIPLSDMTQAPEDIRIIIIIVEQIRGVPGGQEFTVHCGVKEY